MKFSLPIAAASVLADLPGVISFWPGGSGSISGRRRLGNDFTAYRQFCVSRLPEATQESFEETRRVGFATSQEPRDSSLTSDKKEQDQQEGESEARAQTQTINQRLLKQIAEQGKGISVPSEASKKIVKKEEDLNGVNPLYAMLGAGGAGLMSWGSWTAMNWFAQAYFSKPPDENGILAVQRVSAFVKQAVVGLFALGTGIFGVTAVGMAAMASVVAVGVAKGELDPSPQASAVFKPSAGSAEKESDLIDQAQARLRKAQEDIKREIGGEI